MLEGDLKVSTLADADPKIEIRGAGYHDRSFQIFITADTDVPRDTIIAHEMEHAIHRSLWKLADFHPQLFPRIVMEYLAMLAALIKAKGSAILYSRAGFWHDLKGRRSRPYAIASALFVGNLLLKHNMEGPEIDIALGTVEGLSFDLEDLRLLDRVIKHGRGEYQKAYRALFGMDMKDIKEVISSL